MSKNIQVKHIPVPALTDDEIKKLSRPQIRYALHAARLGNENGDTLPIINYYLPRMAAYGLLRHEFSVDWDVDQDDPRNIVSGHIVRKYNEDLKSSLFNEDGTLKGSDTYLAPYKYSMDQLN